MLSLVYEIYTLTILQNVCVLPLVVVCCELGEMYIYIYIYIHIYVYIYIYGGVMNVSINYELTT